jgi:hypothetical protein|nr:MAG TPA: hypothetical protein [Caudoviricetes sp.]
MKPSEYFRNKVEMCLRCLPDRALNAGIDVVSTIIVFETTMPYTAEDYQHALEAWLQGRHDVWQSRIDAYKSNPTNENLATIAECAIYEHTPHTQCDYDDIVERAYRLAIDETLIENELEKRRNNGER